MLNNRFFCSLRIVLFTFPFSILYNITEHHYGQALLLPHRSPEVLASNWQRTLKYNLFRVQIPSTQMVQRPISDGKPIVTKSIFGHTAMNI